MRPGKVVTIRVNPMDCMSVIHVLDAAGISYGNLSYASMTAQALAILIQTAKNGDMIPEPDAYQYANMMAPYADATRSRTKLIANENMQLMRRDMPAHGLIQKNNSINTEQPYVTQQEIAEDPIRKRMMTMFLDYEFKRKEDKNNVDAFEKSEWLRLYGTLFSDEAGAEFAWENMA